MNSWWFGFAVGANAAFLVAWLLDLYFKREYSKLVDEAFVRGADLSVRNHAATVRREKRLNVQGFALRCECGQVYTSIQSVRNEYCDCPTCGRHNPAPLPVDKESEVAK